MLRLRTFGGIWLEGSDGVRMPNPGPRRLAFLAILASYGQRGISRSRLCAIFWPDSEDDVARHTLRQTIYALRRDLGIPAVLADADLRLDPTVIEADVDQLRSAVSRRDWGTVDRVYRGPFADGFVLEDAPEFNRWLEDERADLGRQAALALEALASESAAAGDRAGAAQAWKRLAGFDPTSSRYASSYMASLALLGDRAAAVAHARHHAAVVRRELDAEPDPEVTRLEAELRAEIAVAREPEARPPIVESRRSAPVEPPGPAAANPPSGSAIAGGRRRLGVAVLAAVALVVAAGLAVRRWVTNPKLPVLAVGQLRDLTPSSSTWMPDVLTTSLARLDLDVVARSRILELLAGGADSIASARTDAARRAGATEIVEGELMAGAGGLLRLDLRRLDLARGTLRAGYSISGADRLGLLDSATTLIASDLRIGRPRRVPAKGGSRSAVALRMYDEGLHAYYGRELATAADLFREALAEDSTFAMAAFYAYRTTSENGGRDPALEHAALRLAERASDRDRLLIRASVGLLRGDPVAPVIAESLVARFPRDPEGLLRAAEVVLASRLITDRERGWLERAIALDSAAASGRRAPCFQCYAIAILGTQLMVADSLEAAEALGRRQIALRPHDPNPVMGLAMTQFSAGRYDAAVETLALLGEIREQHPFARPVFIGRLLNGRLDEADEECRVNLAQRDPRIVSEYRWLCAIVWRNQGRYRDAAALVFAGTVPGIGPLKVALQRDVVSESVIDLESGRPLAALRALDSIAPVPQADEPPGVFARHLSWSLARRGTAAAIARQLDVVRRLADSVEIVGRGSLFGRDPRLHYYLRGLTAQASNDHETAIDFFRRSILSWTYGYTRANYEMARSLLALRRPGEAIAPLRSALRGGWDGSNLYLTRTELHELLGQAFAGAGRRDSALAHYALVERAWRRADPPFAARYQAARDYLTRNGVTP